MYPIHSLASVSPPDTDLSGSQASGFGHFLVSLREKNVGRRVGNGSTVPQQGVFRRLDMFACGGLSQASRCPAAGGGDGGQCCPHTPYTP